jgi:feruloyl esterase
MEKILKAWSLLALAALLATAALAPARAAAQQPCETLTTLNLPDVTITSATSEPAGTFTPPPPYAPIPNLPAFCRVVGVATPTSDSVINFEVWMPATIWNGKFSGAGNGGYGGSFSSPYGWMAGGLRRGYTSAGCDMGHDATATPGASFALGHPEKIADWGYRANHVTAMAGKAILQAFYGTGPQLSYFTGCSDGGHEGLMEAQRYPGDYDGVLAGASANFWSRQSAAWVWEARAALDDPASYIPAAKLPMISQAAVIACDGLDGVIDGLIGDPRRCSFDPATLQCSGPDDPSCLTAEQVDAVKKIYAGPTNPRTAEQIYPGLEPGGEFGWATLIAGPETFLGGDFFKYMVFQDPTWDFHTLDFDRDIALADATLAPIVDSTSSDLSGFRSRGGKLLMYHGWADPLVNPPNSINYFQSVVGGDLSATQQYFRLFMEPGMAHCSGGPGLNTFDAFTALERWVEQGIAPDAIMASHSAGLSSPDTAETAASGEVMQPLCPFPKVARYVGRGNPKNAENFVCGEELSCESLTGLNLPDTTITSAKFVPAGDFVPPGGTPLRVPAFCRAVGVATPTSDSVINFEVWLPTAGWNGKFNGIGNGGYGGSIPYGSMARPLFLGYVTAGTDMGHDAIATPGGTWAFGHPEKIVDWGRRAIHVTAVAGKAVLEAFYGTAPQLSYFTGCSDGGHEALMEAQRYPDDYVGIVAGASANFWTHQSAAWVWEEERQALDDPDSVIPASKLQMITDAAVAACDAIDGVVDGLIDDPRRCDFDPASLQCPGPDAPTCLTAEQMQAVRDIYAGPRNPRTGEQIYPGLQPGGEFGWPGDRGSLGRDFYKYMVFGNPNWDFHTLDFDQDITTADALGPVIDSTNPDLSQFRALGGKLIMYHGWNDPRVNPQNSINYIQSVAAQDPAQGTAEFLRLFMVPGMGHCGGGPGPNTFDTLTALEKWVEQSVAPERIIASGGDVRGRTRPLCPYPQVARFTGQGSIDDAASFVCTEPGD